MTWHRSGTITMALRAGRRPDEIHLIACGACAAMTYYNPASHRPSEHRGAHLDHLVGAGEVITLQDVWDAEEAAAIEELAMCPTPRSHHPSRDTEMRPGPDVSPAALDAVPNHGADAHPRNPGRMASPTT